MPTSTMLPLLLILSLLHLPSISSVNLPRDDNDDTAARMTLQSPSNPNLDTIAFTTHRGGGSPALHNILANTHHSPSYHYPTDFTRGILPKPLHSHNDYWRPVPFYSALAAGASSVEADVWYDEDDPSHELYVGHEPAALTATRTLRSLYIDPILDTLRRQNPARSPLGFHTQEEEEEEEGEERIPNGVYDTDAGRSLTLLIDLKTSPSTTWPAVLAALSPLRHPTNYLTTFEPSNTTKNGTANGKLTVRPITVIGTGLTPLSAIRSSLSAGHPIFAFYDAHLDLLLPPDTTSDTTTADADADAADDDERTLTSTIAPLASAPLQSQFGLVNSSRGLDVETLQKIQGQVEAAHKRGMKARYWDLPAWPTSVRNVVWRQLLDVGVDVLNVDDLAGACGFWEGRGV